MRLSWECHTIVHVVISWVVEEFFQHWLAKRRGAELELACFFRELTHDE